VGPRRGVDAYPPRNPLWPRGPPTRDIGGKAPHRAGLFRKVTSRGPISTPRSTRRFPSGSFFPESGRTGALLRWQRKRGILRSVKALSMAGSIFERSRFRLLIVRRFALIAEAKAKDAWERKACAR